MSDSRLVVYGALAGNLAIAATKFVVAAVTGSAAMLSEGIHSVVDTGNSILLLVGLRRSRRRPDATHPFGYGKELYFWSLIVAVMIFGVGGGMSAYEGVLHILHPVTIEHAGWSYIVLGVVALFEGTSFGIALYAFLKKKRRNEGFWHSLHISKDPSVFTVMAEDGVALAGLAIAAIGIYCSSSLGMPLCDGIASVAIGLLLAGAATLLIYENRGLLVGEGVRGETADDIRKLALTDEAIVAASPPKTMYLGPDEVLLALDVQFKKGLAGASVDAAIRRIEKAIRERYPIIRRIYIEAKQSS